MSSRIEGTQASLSDLFFFEAAGESSGETSDVREVSNYVVALEYGLQRLQEFPLSLRLIRELHERLMTGARGEHLTPGEFRRSQNWIGPPGCTLMEATYVPPPVPEMNEALDAFEKYLYAEARLPPLVQLALVHYQFEAIHPFLDGNGRIGRLLLTLLMVREGLLPQPLLYLSAFFERYREDYYRLLLAVSQRGAWVDWVTFFLRGVAVQAQDAVERANRLLDLWQTYRRQFQTGKSSGALLNLLDKLIEYPVITLPRAAKLLGVTFRAASMNVEKLVRAEVLREVTGRSRNRIFAASEFIRILESPEAQPDEGATVESNADTA